jgi:putative peptidoglycan lipid II flippase
LNIRWTKDLQNSIKNILPLIASSAFSKSNILIDRFFASSLSSGSITLLHYGEHIIKVISSFINKGISLVSLRKFSLYNEDNGKFESLFYYVNKVIIFLCVPLLFGIAFFFNDTLKIIVFSEKLTPDIVSKLYLVIIALLGMFISGNLNSILTNVFYAKKLTVLISKTNIITQIYGIILKISMFYVLGFWGLPIAFSMTSLTVTVVLYYLYHKKINKLKILSILNYLFKVTIISLIAVLIPKLIVIYFIDNWILIIILEWLIFAILFGIISIKFERDISKSIINQLFKNNKISK